MSVITTRRKNLTTKQLAVLRLLYRFRFGTTELLTQALELKNKTKMNKRLQLLLEQEYIGRNYNPEYRLLRKHASYYLLPKGIKALKEAEPNYDQVVLHNLHKDKTASEQFINHSLAVFKHYCDLKAQYGDSLRFFTKSQLAQFDYFPKPLPDAYIRLKVSPKEKQYFLEVLQSTRPFFVAVRKARRYISYADDGEWEATNTMLPNVLLVCDGDTLRKRLEKHVANLDDIDEDLKFFVTTDPALLLPKTATREKPEAA